MLEYPAVDHSWGTNGWGQRLASNATNKQDLNVAAAVRSRVEFVLIRSNCTLDPDVEDADVLAFTLHYTQLRRQQRRRCPHEDQRLITRRKLHFHERGPGFRTISPRLVKATQRTFGLHLLVTAQNECALVQDSRPHPAGALTAKAGQRTRRRSIDLPLVRT